MQTACSSACTISIAIAMNSIFRKNKHKLVGLVLAITLALFSIIPTKIAIAFYQAPVPQAIFVLGGDLRRMEFTANFWRSHTDLDIWVSENEHSLALYQPIAQRFGVPNEKLHLDGRAIDTVTNFTTLVGDFVNQKIQHTYLITSDYHMRRARAIASIVFGSEGIVVTPLSVLSSGDSSESVVRVLRDCGRSLLWIFTNRTGASLNPRLKVIQSSVHKSL